MLADVVDLVLPAPCAGCAGEGALRYGVCDACVVELHQLRPHPTRPDPAPDHLPGCAALGPYHGVLRELVLAYKDRGRHRLARPLGRLLAQVVHSVVDGPVVLVPIPDTPAAARARHGDHLRRLVGPAAARLRRSGVRVTVAVPLRARPRPDSAGLDTAARAAAAQSALRVRRLRAAGLRRHVLRTGDPVILVDDVLTTGATLAVATARLAEAGIPVAGAAVLAATRRTRPWPADT